MNGVQLFCPQCDLGRTRSKEFELHYVGPQRQVVHGYDNGPFVKHFLVAAWYCPKCLSHFYDSVELEK